MNDEKYLREVVEFAKQSDEPLGYASILIDGNGMEVARTINSQRKDNLTASHAEMKAIAAANMKMGRKLKSVTAYGNCEPCTMCLTALVFAEVERIIFTRRMNDFANDDRKIDIDCFECVKKFPYQPKLELHPL